MDGGSFQVLFVTFIKRSSNSTTTAEFLMHSNIRWKLRVLYSNYRYISYNRIIGTKHFHCNNEIMLYDKIQILSENIFLTIIS